MLTDPLFIIGLLGMTVCLFSWIKFSIEQNDVEPIVVKYISTISFISADIKLIVEIYLTTIGSTSFCSIENLIQLKRHTVIPSKPIINNGSVNILLLRVKIIQKSILWY